jgi:hypothetical protein
MRIINSAHLTETADAAALPPLEQAIARYFEPSANYF